MAHQQALGQILECQKLKFRLVDLRNVQLNMMTLTQRAKRLHFSGYGDNLRHGDVVPQTPVSAAGDVLDDTPIEDMMSPAKASKRDDSGGISLLDIEPN